MKTYICKNCGQQSKVTLQKYNIYCSNKCKGESQFKNTIERFNKGVVSDRTTLRKVLSEVNGYSCSVCNINEYNNMHITLQVDHINGDASDNNPKNLRLICPNCHSQTKTFGGKNKGSGRKSKGLPLK